MAGTAVFKVFDLHVARTGLNVVEAREARFDPAETVIQSRSRARTHPGSTTIHVQMVGDRQSGKLLGAQMVGREDVAHRLCKCPTLGASEIVAGLRPPVRSAQYPSNSDSPSSPPRECWR